MRLRVTREVWVPDDATHYGGDLLDGAEFFKVTQAGDHWWRWDLATSRWIMSGHSEPKWIKPLSSEPDLLRLLCLADEVIMELNGCFPLRGPLYDKCVRIRAATGDDFVRRQEMAAEAMR